MSDLFSGFNPPHPNWADKQKEQYQKVCTRRKALFSRRGKNGEGLYKLIKEKGQELGIDWFVNGSPDLVHSRLSFFFSGRTYNDDIVKVFHAVADEKELEYA